MDATKTPFTDTQFAVGSGTAAHQEASSGVDLSHSEDEVEHHTVNFFDDSPWGFVASRYALTLAIMAIVVNRIAHICRPQGRPRPLPRTRRLAIQLPTILFLAYTSSLLLLVTLKAFFPHLNGLSQLASRLALPEDVQALVGLRLSSSEQLHQARAALLWRLYLSICFAILSTTFLRTLEGQSSTLLTADENIGNSPFSLVGFAVILHLHSTSRAMSSNRHTNLTVYLMVAELLGVQICTCWVNRPPISHLALTSFFGIISTIHYLLAVQSGDYEYPVMSMYSRALDLAIMVRFLVMTILEEQWLTIFTICSPAIIALTLFLHALTAAVTDTPLSFSRLIDPRILPVETDNYGVALWKLGTACLSSTRLSGMDTDFVDIITSQETWVEVDGAKATVRAPSGRVVTGAEMGGLGREIRSIRSTRKGPSSMHGGQQRISTFSTPRWREAQKFSMMLLKTIQALFVMAGGKIQAVLPFELPSISIPLWAARLPRKVRLMWHGTNGEERRNARLAESRRRAEADRRRLESDRLFSARREAEASAAALGSTTGISTAHRESALQQRRRDPVANSTRQDSYPSTSWHRYFSQADFAEGDEDEDEEWIEEAADESLKSRKASADHWESLGSGSRLFATESDDRSDDDGDDDDDDDDDEYLDKFSDNQDADIDDINNPAELLSLARVDFEDEDDEDYSRILMAHMSSRGEGMMTRRGYRSILSGRSQAEEQAQHLLSVIQQRRVGPDSLTAADDRDRIRLCVICYIEDRTIICWPCKCLAICEGCREAMATRPPSRNTSDTMGHMAHNCPTCRTPVSGFSRIFMP